MCGIKKLQKSIFHPAPLKLLNTPVWRWLREEPRKSAFKLAPNPLFGALIALIEGRKGPYKVTAPKST